MGHDPRQGRRRERRPAQPPDHRGVLGALGARGQLAPAGRHARSEGERQDPPGQRDRRVHVAVPVVQPGPMEERDDQDPDRDAEGEAAEQVRDERPAADGRRGAARRGRRPRRAWGRSPGRARSRPGSCGAARHRPHANRPPCLDSARPEHAGGDESYRYQRPRRRARRLRRDPPARIRRLPGAARRDRRGRRASARGRLPAHRHRRRVRERGARRRGRPRSGLERDEVFVTTKCFNDDHGFDEATQALRRSSSGSGWTVDLYLIHWPVPPRDRFVETWRAFDRAPARGALVRSIGVSNFQPAAPGAARSTRPA